MISSPHGRYPLSEHYRLNNEDQLFTNIPRSVQRPSILELLEHPVR
jgi:hypothetical protein